MKNRLIWLVQNLKNLKLFRASLNKFCIQFLFPMNPIKNKHSEKRIYGFQVRFHVKFQKNVKGFNAIITKPSVFPSYLNLTNMLSRMKFWRVFMRFQFIKEQFDLVFYLFFNFSEEFMVKHIVVRNQILNRYWKLSLSYF